MNIIKTLIIAVLVTVTGAKGGDLEGTISDDLEQKTGDLLTSLSAEITKSDVEITLSGLKTPEDVTKDAIEASDSQNDDKNDKTLQDTAELKSEQEAASSLSSAEDVQKITHTSDDNASFIHVKEKVARHSFEEDYAESDYQQKGGNAYGFMENIEPQKASDNLTNAQESETVDDNGETKSDNDKEVETSEKSGLDGADDIEDLFKTDTVDIDATTQSRRMLSFDHKLLDTKNILNTQSEPINELRSGKNDRESILLQPDSVNYNHGHQVNHDDYDHRRGSAFIAKQLTFPPLSASTLPPLSLFQFSGQPSQIHFQPSDDIHNIPHSLDKGLPSLLKQIQGHQKFDGHHQDHQDFNAVQQLLSHSFEQFQPQQAFRQLQPSQSLQREQYSKPLQSLSTFQPLQTFHTVQPFSSFQTWPPAQSLQYPHSQLPSLASSSSMRSATSFQPSQYKMDSIFSRLHDASQHPVHSELSPQFSDLFQKNWNTVSNYHSYLGGK